MLFLLPVLGLAVWLADVRRRLTHDRRGATFATWFLGLPLGAALAFAGWELFVPRPPPGPAFLRRPDEVWLGNALLGLALWAALLVLELPLALLAARSRSVRGRRAPG